MCLLELGGMSGWSGVGAGVNGSARLFLHAGRLPKLIGTTNSDGQPVRLSKGSTKVMSKPFYFFYLRRRRRRRECMVCGGVRKIEKCAVPS